MTEASDEEYEGDLADIDAVKRWLRDRRDAAGLTQEELATFMNASTRVVLNAEKEGDPKAGLPRGYPFSRMLQRLGAVVPEAPVPAGPTLHDRLAAIEARVEKDAFSTATSLLALGEAIDRIERLLQARGDDGRQSGQGPS